MWEAQELSHKLSLSLIQKQQLFPLSQPDFSLARFTLAIRRIGEKQDYTGLDENGHIPTKKDNEVMDINADQQPDLKKKTLSAALLVVS